MDNFDKKIKQELGKNEHIGLSEEQLISLRNKVANNKNRPKKKFRAVFVSAVSVACIAVISVMSIFLYYANSSPRYLNSDDCVLIDITEQQVINYVTDEMLPTEEINKLEFKSGRIYKVKDSKKVMAVELIYYTVETMEFLRTSIAIIIELKSNFNYTNDNFYTVGAEQVKVNNIPVFCKNIKEENVLPENYRKFNFNKHGYYMYSKGLNENYVDVLIHSITK